MIDDTIKTALATQDAENYDDDIAEDTDTDDDDELSEVEGEAGDDREDEADGEF